MPIFASRTSRGFTLLEVLVVIAIMAVLTGVVVLGFTGADQIQRQRGIAEQLSQKLQLVRQRSLQRNKTWGLVLEPQAYRFAEYDLSNELWVEQTERPFAARALADDLEWRVQVEGETLIAGDKTNEDDIQPNVLFFASGEVTPFTVTLESVRREVLWTIECDGLSPIRLFGGEEES